VVVVVRRMEPVLETLAGLVVQVVVVV
jgi:hypothetical protein